MKTRTYNRLSLTQKIKLLKKIFVALHFNNNLIIIIIIIIIIILLFFIINKTILYFSVLKLSQKIITVYIIIKSYNPMLKPTYIECVDKGLDGYDHEYQL